MNEKVNIIIEDNGLTILRKFQLTILEIMKIVDKACRENDINYWIDGGTLLGAVRHEGFIPWDDDLDICMLRDDYNKFLNIINQYIPKELVLENRYTNTWVQDKMNKKHSFTKIYYLDRFKSFDKSMNTVATGAYIDIFPMDEINSKMSRKKIYSIINSSSRFVIKKPSSLKEFILKHLSKLQLDNIWFKECDHLKNRENINCIIYGIDTPFMSDKYIQYKEDIFPLIEMKFEEQTFYAPKNYHKYLTRMYGDYMKLPDENERHYHLEGLEI